MIYILKVYKPARRILSDKWIFIGVDVDGLTGCVLGSGEVWRMQWRVQMWQVQQCSVKSKSKE